MEILNLNKPNRKPSKKQTPLVSKKKKKEKLTPLSINKKKIIKVRDIGHGNIIIIIIKNRTFIIFYS